MKPSMNGQFAYMILLGSIALSGPLWAASNDAVLRQLQGSVLLNHATGFSNASANAPLRADDRVFTMANSQATVVWPDGCIVQLRENSMFTFKKLSPCQGGADTRKNVGAYYARAIGADVVTDVPITDAAPQALPTEAATTTAVPSELTPAVTETAAATSASGGLIGGFSTLQVIVTGVAVGTGVAVIASSGGNKDKGNGNGAVSPE